MDLLYACRRIKDAAEEYASFLRDGNDQEAASSLRRIRKLVSCFGDDVKQGRMDSVFFAGELDAKAGEHNVQYPGHKG